MGPPITGMQAAAMGVAAVAFVFAGFALRRVWLHRHGRRIHAALAAAATLLGSATVVAAFEAETGIPTAFAIASPAVVLVVFSGRMRRTHTHSVTRTLRSNDQATVVRDTIRVLLSVLLSGIVAILTAAALVAILPFAAPTRSVVAVYLLPLLWAGAMAWALSASNLKPLLLTGAIATLYAALIVAPRLLGAG